MLKKSSLLIGICVFLLTMMMSVVSQPTSIYAGASKSTIKSIDSQNLSTLAGAKQIYIETGHGSPTRIVIRGYNQHGNYATWDSNWGNMQQVYQGGSFWNSYAHDWWWQGPVTVTIYNGTNSKNCSFNVSGFFGSWFGYYCGYLP